MFGTSKSHNDMLKALIAFYEDEQYWVRRARRILEADAEEPVRVGDSYTPMDTSPDIPMPTSVPSRPPTQLSMSRDGDGLSDEGVSPSAMTLDTDATSRARRQNRTRLDIDDLLVQPRHGSESDGATAAAAARPSPASPQSDLSSRILETFSDLMDARMESCQRMSRLIEMRECRLF